MVKSNLRQGVHCCECLICQQHPRGPVAREHRAINRLLAVADERLRRIIAGLLAKQMGRGGITRLSHVTGLDRKTIAKGQLEIRHGLKTPRRRLRRLGAGRKRMEQKHPGS
jgi:hypothetical protein